MLFVLEIIIFLWCQVNVKAFLFILWLLLLTYSEHLNISFGLHATRRRRQQRRTRLSECIIQDSFCCVFHCFMAHFSLDLKPLEHFMNWQCDAVNGRTKDLVRYLCDDSKAQDTFLVNLFTITMKEAVGIKHLEYLNKQIDLMSFA